MHESFLLMHSGFVFFLLPKKCYVSIGLAVAHEINTKYIFDNAFDGFGCLCRNTKVFDHG